MLNTSLLARICSPRPPSRTGSEKSMNLVAIPPYQIMIMDHSSDPNLRQNSWRMHCPTRNRSKKWQPNSLENEDKHDSGSDPAPKTLISTDQQSPPFLKAVQTSDIVWWASKFGSWSTTQGRCERCLSRAMWRLERFGAQFTKIFGLGKTFTPSVDYPLVICYKKLLNMVIEIVDFPIENGGSFHSYFDITRGYWEITWIRSAPWHPMATFEGASSRIDGTSWGQSSRQGQRGQKYGRNKPWDVLGYDYTCSIQFRINEHIYIYTYIYIIYIYIRILQNHIPS